MAHKLSQNESAKSHRGLPDKGQEKEEEGNDRQDVYQGAKSLVSLGQLSQRGAVGNETDQQVVSHRNSEPQQAPDSDASRYHMKSASESDQPDATSSAKQPAALARALAVVEACWVELHGRCAMGCVRRGQAKDQ